MKTQLDGEDIVFSVDHFHFLYKLVAKNKTSGNSGTAQSQQSKNQSSLQTKLTA